jgi:dienelactone hydrolase
MTKFRGLIQDLTSFLPSGQRSDSPKASLSTTPTTSSTNIIDYSETESLAQSAHANDQRLCSVKKVSIKVADSRGGSVAGFLHLPANYGAMKESGRSITAAILLSGARGGVVGPSSMYLAIGDKLASLDQGIPALRLDYRFPARNKYCVQDVYAAMKVLEKDYAVSKFVLIGWSFGGAPVFTVGGAEKGRVAGCATVASQVAEAGGIQNLSPRPLLLLHGTADTTLSSEYSQTLYRVYGPAGDRVIHLFEDDDHALTKSAAQAEEMLSRFVMKCAGMETETVEDEGF